MRKHYPLNALGVEDAGRLPWSDGVPATGTEGSYPGHAIVTDAEAELLNAQGLAGLSPSGSDLSQLGQAIARGIFLGGFSGTANALSASLPNSVVVQQILRGMRFTGYTSVANTAGVTVTLTGFAQAPGTLSLLRRDGTALQPGDLPVAADFDFRFDGVNYRLIAITPSEIAGYIPSAPQVTPVSQWHVGTAGGTASAVLVSDLLPTIGSYADKLPIFLLFPNGIADNATANIGGLGAIPIQRNDGSAIQRGDVPVAGAQLFNLYQSGGNFALRLAGYGRTEVQRLVVNPILWVRPDGNDANDGSDNTPGKAFRTIAGAASSGTNQYNFAASTLTIRLGVAGTYDALATLPRGSGTIQIIGDQASQASYVIAGAGAAGVGLLSAISAVTLLGVTLQITGGQGHAAVSGPGGVLLAFYTTFDTGGGTNGSHVFGSGGSITLATGCVIKGNAQSAIWANGGTGYVQVNTSTVLNVSGTPTFTSAFALATKAGQIAFQSGGSVSGSANGPRYLAQDYAIIDTNGGGPNAFPGSSAGSTTNATYR